MNMDGSGGNAPGDNANLDEMLENLFQYLSTNIITKYEKDFAFQDESSTSSVVILKLGKCEIHLTKDSIMVIKNRVPHPQRDVNHNEEILSIHVLKDGREENSGNPRPSFDPHLISSYRPLKKKSKRRKSKGTSAIPQSIFNQIGGALEDSFKTAAATTFDLVSKINIIRTIETVEEVEIKDDGGCNRGSLGNLDNVNVGNIPESITQAFTPSSEVPQCPQSEKEVENDPGPAPDSDTISDGRIPVCIVQALDELRNREKEMASKEKKEEKIKQIPPAYKWLCGRQDVANNTEIYQSTVSTVTTEVSESAVEPPTQPTPTHQESAHNGHQGYHSVGTEPEAFLLSSACTNLETQEEPKFCRRTDKSIQTGQSQKSKIPRRIVARQRTSKSRLHDVLRSLGINQEGCGKSKNFHETIDLGDEPNRTIESESSETSDVHVYRSNNESVIEGELSSPLSGPSTQAFPSSSGRTVNDDTPIKSLFPLTFNLKKPVRLLKQTTLKNDGLSRSSLW